MHGPARKALAALVLVAGVTGLRSPLYSLREIPPSSCGFAHFGSTTGSAQRLVETHLSPGVADWNIVVPMPPPCAQVPVTGVHMRVCDGDAPPDVSLSDAQSARVHRTGALAGFAAVNVTVYCILPPSTPPHSYLEESRATYEVLSRELSSNEATYNEEISTGSESIELTSAELITTAKPTSSTTTTTTTITTTTILVPAPEEITAQVDLTSPAEVITPPPHKTVYPKEKTPQSVKVTIDITPTNQASTKEDVSQSNDAELPSLLSKEKPDEVKSSQNSTLQSVPFIATPSRMSELAPPSRPLGASSPRAPLSQRDPPRLPRPPRQHLGPPRPPHNMQVLQYMQAPQNMQAPQYMQTPQYMQAPPYSLSPPPPPYSFVPIYRPLSLLGPRLSFLQRQQPLLIYRHF